MKTRKSNQKFAILFTGLALLSSSVLAQSNEIMGFYLTGRVMGSNPSPQTWVTLKTKAIQGDWAGLATDAMATMEFSNSFMRNFSETICGGIGLALDDCKATIITAAAQDVSFKKALWFDMVARQKNSGTPVSKANNTHYANISVNDAFVDYVNNMEMVTQSSVYGFQNPAGLLTGRGFALPRYLAGTNRKMISDAFALLLGNDLEKRRNPNRGDTSYVRPDVKQSELTDNKYATVCLGCHASLEPITIAFKQIDVANNQINELPTVAPKYFRPYASAAQVPAGGGFVTTVNDNWRNFYGQELGTRTNAVDGIATQADLEVGTNLKQLGAVLGNSRAFSTQMASYIAKTICNIEDLESLTVAETAYIGKIADALEANDTYIFKNAMRTAAVEAINYGCIPNE